MRCVTVNPHSRGEQDDTVGDFNFGGRLIPTVVGNSLMQTIQTILRAVNPHSRGEQRVGVRTLDIVTG